MTAIERYIKEQERIIEKDKENTLIELGIVEREYSPNGLWTGVYNKTETINGEKKYFREVPAKVTDEEYALILQKAKQVQEIQSRKEIKRKGELDKYDSPEDRESKLAKILRIVAEVIFVLALVGGGIIAAKVESFVVFIGVALGSTVELLLFCALAEILDHLKEIAYYARKKK